MKKTAVVILLGIVVTYSFSSYGEWAFMDGLIKGGTNTDYTFIDYDDVEFSLTVFSEQGWYIMSANVSNTDHWSASYDTNFGDYSTAETTSPVEDKKDSPTMFTCTLSGIITTMTGGPGDTPPQYHVNMKHCGILYVHPYDGEISSIIYGKEEDFSSFLHKSGIKSYESNPSQTSDWTLENLAGGDPLSSTGTTYTVNGNDILEVGNYKLTASASVGKGTQTDYVEFSISEPTVDITAHRPNTPHFDMLSVPDNEELSQGAGIRINGDDDDGNGVVDRNDSAVGGEDDLIRVDLYAENPETPPTGHDFKLRVFRRISG